MKRKQLYQKRLFSVFLISLRTKTLKRIQETLYRETDYRYQKSISTVFEILRMKTPKCIKNTIYEITKAHYEKLLRIMSAFKLRYKKR